MTGYDQSKYRVFKVSEEGDEVELDPDTYFLLRQKDLIGLPTLYSYVHNVRMILEASQLFKDPDQLSREHRDHLEGLAEGASDLAFKWEELWPDRRLPD